MSIVPALGRGKQRIAVNWRPAWAAHQVPGQPGLHREVLPQTKQKEIAQLIKYVRN